MKTLFITLAIIVGTGLIILLVLSALATIFEDESENKHNIQE